jgi:hypothetical protein
MARIVPDFSEAVGGIIPTGTYPIRVMAAESTTSKKSGAPMIKWTLAIFGAEGDMARYNNRDFNYWTMVNGKGAGRLQEFLRALNVNEKDFDTDELTGKEALAVLVEGKTENGEPSMRPEVKAIKKYNQ